MKFFNKWFRRLHRWLTLPVIVLLLTAMIARGTTTGDIAQRIQGPLIISLAITGAYLFLLPYLTKWKRTQRKTSHQLK